MVEIDEIAKVFGGGNDPTHKVNIGTASDIYYEKKLAKIFADTADNRDCVIESVEGWNLLTSNLLKTKLASVKDKDRLERVKPSFPLSFETFISTIH